MRLAVDGLLRCSACLCPRKCSAASLNETGLTGSVSPSSRRRLWSSWRPCAGRGPRPGPVPLVCRAGRLWSPARAASRRARCHSTDRSPAARALPYASTFGPFTVAVTHSGGVAANRA